MAWSDAARAAAAEARRRNAKPRKVYSTSLTVSAPKGGWPKSLKAEEASARMQKGSILPAHHPYQGEGFYAKNKSGAVRFFSSSGGGSKTLAQRYSSGRSFGLARDGARKSRFGG